MSDLSQSLLLNAADDSSSKYAVLDDTAASTSYTSYSAFPAQSTALREFLLLRRRTIIISVAVTIIAILAILVLVVASRSPPHHPACDSLYNFACKAWLDNTTLAPGQSSFARSFSAMNVQNTAVLADILATGRGDPLLPTLYTSCLDVATIRALGPKPLEPYLEQLRHVDSWPAWFELAGSWRMNLSVPLLFTTSVRLSPVQPDTAYLQVSASGLSFQRSDQYNNATQVAQLRSNISRVFRDFLGDNDTDANANAAAVLDVERWLAALMAATSTRGYGAWNPVADLTVFRLPFDAYIRGANLTAVVDGSFKHYTVPSPTFFLNLTAALQGQWSKPTPAFIQYARWRLVAGMAFALSTDVFALLPRPEPLPSYYFPRPKGPLLEPGVSADDPRAVTCRRVVNSPDALADLLGVQFMHERFPHNSSIVVSTMVDEIRAAWTAYLPSITWLDTEAMMQFQKKMDNMKIHWGGPQPLAAYSDLELHNSTLLDNIVRLRALHNQHIFGGLVGVFDSARNWNGLPASTVNAFYNSVGNSAFLFAGFFQAPFFAPSNGSDPLGVDPIMNFPWTGEVAGHEAGHGFDTNGIKFDEIGSNHTWLSAPVLADFNTRVRCVQASYSRLSMYGISVNGYNSISENLADVIGIRLAYVAYQRWLARQPVAPRPPADFVPQVDTADQYFFTRWAQTECVKQTPESLREQIQTDTHSPGFARVDGAGQVFAPFSDAFNCPKGSFMNPRDQCFIY